MNQIVKPLIQGSDLSKGVKYDSTSEDILFNKHASGVMIFVKVRENEKFRLRVEVQDYSGIWRELHTFPDVHSLPSKPFVIHPYASRMGNRWTAGIADLPLPKCPWRTVVDTMREIDYCTQYAYLP